MSFNQVQWNFETIKLIRDLFKGTVVELRKIRDLTIQRGYSYQSKWLRETLLAMERSGEIVIHRSKNNKIDETWVCDGKIADQIVWEKITKQVVQQEQQEPDSTSNLHLPV